MAVLTVHQHRRSFDPQCHRSVLVGVVWREIKTRTKHAAEEAIASLRFVAQFSKQQCSLQFPAAKKNTAA